jgi:transposase-like protein
MRNNKFSLEFKEQVLRKVRERGSQTLSELATEMNVPFGTLKGWIRRQAVEAAAMGLPHGADPLPADQPANSWDAAQRLQALNESHALQGEELHAWCRQKGLYAHQLQQWRAAFCADDQAQQRHSRSAMRELQAKNDKLARELRHKEKALAEAAALLVLQKKFQALWADEV